MIDPTQLPILLKAIDFVFEEGRKILEERRERRKAQENPQKAEIQAPVQEIPAPETQPKEEIKQDLLASKIDEILWQKYEWEVESLVKQLESHTQSYYILKEQYAKWGSALVPPVIIIQMEEKENSIIETKKQLETILSKVYKKEIHLAT
jgi:hypothetical protein